MKENKSINFVDLFAGIGGFHVAIKEVFNAKCVFASEWDKYAADVYEANFGLRPKGDITKIQSEDIPNHDVLCGGFPCQAFSVSGKQRGFEDTRGTLFFDVARIIEYHKPKVVFLENVKNLLKHDDGKTFKRIECVLNEIGYNVYHKILNASHFGIPQNRERVYIVCFKKELNLPKFKFPSPTLEPCCVADILEDNKNISYIQRDDISFYKEYIVERNLQGEEVLPYKPIQIGKVNKGGQGERIYHLKGHGITLSAYGGGVGAKTGLFKTEKGIRRLTPRECARMQGFNDDFILSPNTNQAYKQFGNSVPVKVLVEIFKSIKHILN